MLETYPAELYADKVIWSGDKPNILDEETPLAVYVTILSHQNRPPEPDGAKMAAALARIAERGTSSFPADAVAWQRETRADRELPGRSE